MHDLERIYRALLRIRRVEEEIARVYPSDVIKSPVHLSIGQEAVSVGLCEALRPEDAVFGSYRSHALYLAKGGDLRAMIAELYGKQTGCASTGPTPAPGRRRSGSKPSASRTATCCASPSARALLRTRCAPARARTSSSV